MGSFSIRYFDTSGLNLYAIINCGGDIISGINTAGNKADYDQSTPSSFAIALSNNTSFDATKYTASLGSFSESTERFFYVRIFQQLTTGYLPQSDLLKAVQYHYYNGLSNNYVTQDYVNFARIEAPDYLGTFTPQGTIRYVLKYRNNDGTYNYAASNFNHYIVYDKNNQVIQTGDIGYGGPSAEYGQATIRLTSGSYAEGDYYIFTSGSMDNVIVPAISYFNIAVPQYHTFGCTTGSISTVTSNSQFVTNLPASGDNHYNGQIFRVVDTTLGGVGRIVSGYIGSSRTVILSKALPYTPSTGSTIMIYPIGGEYNVS